MYGYALGSLLATAALLAGGANAAALDKRANPTDIWVSVDGDGKPSTVTPVATTVSGTPTVLSGAPNEITGTVFTVTSMGAVRTSTGITPLVTATAANGAGAFARCFNKDGSNGVVVPFCTPGNGSTLFVDRTYYGIFPSPSPLSLHSVLVLPFCHRSFPYVHPSNTTPVTWDPDFFAAPNITSDKIDVRLQASKHNTTTNAILGDPIDLTETKRANLGFAAWKIDGSLLAGLPGGNSGINITLRLAYNQIVGGNGVKELIGPTILVAYTPAYHPEPTKLPEGAALYIGLPTIAGVVLLCVIGTCIWNRKARQIGIGNVMSRSRHGYGVGKSRAQRLGARVRKSMGRGKDHGAIQLVEREVPYEQQYRDAPERGRTTERARRDSDLGSLAGSPVGDRFRAQGVSGGGRNVFREEMRRQDQDRF
jgi:hypothetical protein